MAQIDYKEAARYLGYLKQDPGPQVAQLLLKCGKALMDAADPRSVSQTFPVRADPESGHVEIAGTALRTKKLAKHIKGCTEAILFAATLGIEVDRLIRKAGIADMSQAVILQACAASLIEAYCDECELPLAADAATRRLYLRPRFSPGYGDFPIEYQKELLAVLNAPKKIGLTATDSMMLTPTKSVTAVIGLTSERSSCHLGRCGSCGMRDCPFRKENKK